MKKILIINLILLLFAASLLYSEETIYYEAPFVPMSPEVMAQGGSFVANAHGYNALFQNPAGFVSKEGSLTVLSTTAWVFANPARFLGDIEDFSVDDFGSLLGVINDEITSGGFGVGASSGIGFVGKGLGFGAVLIADSYIYGPTLLGATGNANLTLGFVAGLALPVNILGIRFQFGADVRPMIRMRTEDFSASLLTSFMGGGEEGGEEEGDPLSSLYAFHGFGLALDAGVIAQLGGLKIGLSFRDLFGTRFNYYYYGLNEIIDAGGFPEPATGAEVDDIIYKIPMDVSFGVAYHPDLGVLKHLIDPVIHADIRDVVGVIRDKRSPWNLIHMGTEIKLLSFFKFRAGFNQGYITLGCGLKLLFLDLNVAMFTRERGKHLGDRPNTGVTAELAIRF